MYPWDQDKTWGHYDGLGADELFFDMPLTFGMDGDPHITTADGVHYAFQGAGEYVALREADSVEIQTRMAPISTTFTPGPCSQKPWPP